MIDYGHWGEKNEEPDNPTLAELEGPRNCGGCALQSKVRADHLPQCSWLDYDDQGRRIKEEEGENDV